MSRRLLLLGLGLALPWLAGAGTAAEPCTQVIDRLIAAGWARANVQPAALSDDPEFARRVYLDLIGRIPSREEVQHFCDDRNQQKRSRLIDDLLAGGEFPRHWRENLNVLLMGSPAFAGNPQWRGWLEESLKRNKPWDAMAREVLQARGVKPEEVGASLFLLDRLAQGPSGLDTVTRDVSRFFFGVDIQCARCHKHPEVDQWKQEAYWGMAAFFNRSYPLTVKGKLYVAERATGEVDYANKTGTTKTAQPRFLTGETVVEPSPAAKPAAAPMPAPAVAKAPAAKTEDAAAYLVPPEEAKEKTRVPVPKFSRREQLIQTAINGRNPYFKRAFVNYVWSQLMGRGLVEPVDQMHDGNPPSHPDLLQTLANDFATHRFDLRYLIRCIANSRTYQLTSRSRADSPRPPDPSYACGAVRPLTLQQLLPSLLVAAGYQDSFQTDPATRSNPGALRAKLEAQYQATLAALEKDLSSGTATFQPGVREALFQANGAAFADFLNKGGLAARLAPIKDDTLLAQEAFWCILSRSPTPEEVNRLRVYLQARADRRPAACQQVVWALATSAEFRFNH
jgi:hypothetical protein